MMQSDKDQVYFLCSAMAWGTYQILQVRFSTELPRKEESTWTLGQVIPVALLLSPFLSIWDNAEPLCQFKGTMRGFKLSCLTFYRRTPWKEDSDKP